MHSRRIGTRGTCPAIAAVADYTSVCICLLETHSLPCSVAVFPSAVFPLYRPPSFPFASNYPPVDTAPADIKMDAPAQGDGLGSLRQAEAQVLSLQQQRHHRAGVAEEQSPTAFPCPDCGVICITGETSSCSPSGFHSFSASCPPLFFLLSLQCTCISLCSRVFITSYRPVILDALLTPAALSWYYYFQPSA